MNKKVQIQEWKSQLYPVRIWIAVTNNIDKLDNRFVDLRSNSELSQIDSKHAAFVQMVLEKKTRNVGVLIIFSSIKNITVGTMAHEATHAAREIWDRIGETSTGMEADAYLVEWIVNLMEQVRKNKYE